MPNNSSKKRNNFREMCCGVAKGVWRLVKDVDEQNHQQHNEQKNTNVVLFSVTDITIQKPHSYSKCYCIAYIKKPFRTTHKASPDKMSYLPCINTHIFLVAIY